MSPLDRSLIAGGAELVGREIDDFRTDIARFRAGAIAEPVFLENRLRLGVYGQRQDGVHMLRSKLPLGLLSADQLEAFADIAEVYGGGKAHLTTRQDIQVHFVQLDETPAVLGTLARAGGTTREACGNVVRNVTAPASSGVDADEAFDVTPHGLALARFFLRHPEAQGLGRKFKVHVAGTRDPRRNLSAIHDVGATAVVRDGARGFRVVVGGGLGPVPYEAQVYAEFVPEAELLPLVQAVLRVFALHGEKENRARARLKFLVASWGIERFREEVERERALFPPQPEWTAHLDRLADADDAPLYPAGTAFLVGETEDEATWLRTNVTLQKQLGYAAVQIRVPTGDLSPAQLRGLAALLREHTGDTLRVTPDQALLLRFVSFDRLVAVRDALWRLGLAGPRAGGLGDTVTCPGADTCKLGITSPRAVAATLEEVLERHAEDPRVERVSIRISGCPNACAQHHVADIGFFGAARSVAGVPAPHYVLLLGGLPGGAARAGEELGSAFGRAVAKVPAARLAEAVDRLLALYREEAEADELFGVFAQRLGRERFRALLADVTELPPPSAAPDAYREPGSAEAFGVRRGVGECAGVVVAASDLLLKDADREADRAASLLEENAGAEAGRAARAAMLFGARALLAAEDVNVAADGEVVAAFKARYYDTGRIFEGVGHTLLAASAEDVGALAPDRLRRLVLEAVLFVEEAHSILGRLAGAAR